MCRQTSQPKIATTTSPLSLCTRATPKRAGRRHTQRSPTAVPVPRSTPHGSDGTAPARCTDMRRPRAIPRRRSRSCPYHRRSWRGGPGDGPGWTVEPASGSSSLPCLDWGGGSRVEGLWRFAEDVIDVVIPKAGRTDADVDPYPPCCKSCKVGQPLDQRRWPFGRT